MTKHLTFTEIRQTKSVGRRFTQEPPPLANVRYQEKAGGANSKNIDYIKGSQTEPGLILVGRPADLGVPERCSRTSLPAPRLPWGGFVASMSYADSANTLRLLSALLLFSVVTTVAGSPVPVPPVTPDPGPPLVPTGGFSGASVSITEEDVAAFMDEFIPRQLAETKIPGASVSVVQKGRIIFAAGYGVADVETGEPVAADRTLFRIASISKLFTATAVMQLVEGGKVDLDRDVNHYLVGVEIPDAYPGKPITLRHLLTHTAGFEESFTGSLARAADKVPPLGVYLSRSMPARVRPPGEITAYSNYGMSLAGYIVEAVSGVPYNRYLEENLFGPLGMRRTTAAQPPAPRLETELAKGYSVGRRGPVAGAFEYLKDAPAGAASATATDMARFMIAQLSGGSYGESRVLGAATAHAMHAKQFVNAPGLRDGMGFGFYEGTITGVRTLQHAGNLVQFHGLLTLVPERNMGIFVAYNSYGIGGDLAEYELSDAFFDRFYPKDKPLVAPKTVVSIPTNDLERFVGNYRITRSNTTGFEKVSTLMTGVRVIVNPDRGLTTYGGLLSKDYSRKERRWIRIAPFTFRAVDSDEIIAFRQAGNTTYLASDADPTAAYQKLRFYEAPRLHLGLLVGSVAVLLLSALSWLVASAISRRRKLHDKPSSKQEARFTRLIHLLATTLALLVSLFVAGMTHVLLNIETVLGYGPSLLLLGVLTLPILISVLCAGVLVHAALAWARGYSVFGRLHVSLAALSALTVVALLGYYNLIGFQL